MVRPLSRLCRPCRSYSRTVLTATKGTVSNSDSTSWLEFLAASTGATNSSLSNHYTTPHSNLSHTPSTAPSPHHSPFGLPTPTVSRPPSSRTPFSLSSAAPSPDSFMHGRKRSRDESSCAFDDDPASAVLKAMKIGSDAGDRRSVG